MHEWIFLWLLTQVCRGKRSGAQLQRGPKTTPSHGTDNDNDDNNEILYYSYNVCWLLEFGNNLEIVTGSIHADYLGHVNITFVGRCISISKYLLWTF